MVPLSCVATTACGEPLSDAECDRLLDRYTEALLREERPELGVEAVELKKQSARQAAHDNPVFEFDRCAARVSRRQFDCAMRAPSADTIERCLTL